MEKQTMDCYRFLQNCKVKGDWQMEDASLEGRDEIVIIWRIKREKRKYSWLFEKVKGDERRGRKRDRRGTTMNLEYNQDYQLNTKNLLCFDLKYYKIDVFDRKMIVSGIIIVVKGRYHLDTSVYHVYYVLYAHTIEKRRIRQ